VPAVVGKVQGGLVDRLRESLRTTNMDEFVAFIRRQIVEQKGRAGAFRPELREAASQELEPGGYWSPEAVSDRIVAYAMKLTGGDPEKLQIALEGVRKGFAEAEKVLGGLPDVVKRTKELTEQKLQELIGQHTEDRAAGA
jgi:hypothetical protein